MNDDRATGSNTWPGKVAAWIGGHRVLSLGVLAGVGLILWGRSFFSSGEKMHHITARVLRGDIHDTVEATGTVNAVITVQVGSQVSGTIEKLNADFNTKVHQGDIIARITPQLFQGALLQAEADLTNAKANVTASEAGLAKAQAALVQTQADYQRAEALARVEIESQQELDLAKANYLSAKASVEGAAASVTQAKAQVQQKEAAVYVARTNLDYTVIHSPIDGTVVARNVDVGQTVAASLQAPTIFTIARDLTKMQVYTNVDESDVGRIKLGAQVAFKVDAYPKEDFHGLVSQIRMNPIPVQNVVTYDAIIDFDNPGQRLFPGMTAYVTIPVATVTGVVKLPNAALRYHPPLSPETVLGLCAKYGVRADPGKGQGALVWKLGPDSSLVPAQVALGITDHTFTEVVRVLAGTLQVGDEVITTSTLTKATSLGAPGASR
jgi:HlyD family secretion protein